MKSRVCVIETGVKLESELQATSGLRESDCALYVAKAGGRNTVALGSLARAKETVASSVAA